MGFSKAKIIKMQIIWEAATVGIMIALILIVIFALMPDAFSTAARVAFTGFIVGFAGHLLFEVSGANKWYCEHGIACRKIG